MRNPALAAALLLIGVATDAGAVDFITPRSLAFLKARGGIEIGVLEHGNAGWRLTLHCDISGASTANRPGNVLHSGLAWWRSVAEVAGNRIYVTIETNVQGPDAPSARCGPAELGSLPAGTYDVYYRDPDGTRTTLGEISVNR
jgi:hypothetical protein